MEGPQLNSANKSFIAGSRDDPVSINVMHRLRDGRFLIGSKQGHLLKCKLLDREISVVDRKKLEFSITCLDAQVPRKGHSLVVAGCQSGDVIVWSKDAIETAFKMISEIVAIHVNEMGDITALGKNGVFKLNTARGAVAYAPSQKLSIDTAVCLDHRRAILGHEDFLSLRSFDPKHPLRKVPLKETEITALAVAPKTSQINSLVCGSYDGDLFLYCWPDDFYERGMRMSLHKKGSPRSRECITALALIGAGSLLISADKTEVTLWQRDTNGLSYHRCVKKPVGGKGDPIVDLAEISRDTFAVGYKSGIVRTFQIEDLPSSSQKDVNTNVAELIQAMEEVSLRETSQLE